MNLEDFKYNYETTFEYASHASNTLTYEIDLLRCSRSVKERFLDGKTVLEKLLELKQTSLFITSMDIEYGESGNASMYGSICYKMDDDLIYDVTVSHDDFMDFVDILKDYEAMERL